MKKILFGGIFLSLFTISCSKDGGEGDDGNTEVYLHTTAGSSWNYRSVDNINSTPPDDYTRISTNRDTTINGKTYHIYSNSSTGESEYNANVGKDYFIYQALPAELGGNSVENLYLKSGAPVNTTWDQSYPLDFSGFTFTATLTNKIIEKGITRVVNGVTYTNVIHVKTDISITGLPPGTVSFSTDIHQFYAPKFGLIEAQNKIDVTILGSTESTDITTTLQSAILL